jgi:hypothetical protein
VLAFLQVATLMPVAQLAQRVSAAKAHFADFKVRPLRSAFGVTLPHPARLRADRLAWRPPQTPAGWDFGKTQTDFVVCARARVPRSYAPLAYKADVDGRVDARVSQPN